MGFYCELFIWRRVNLPLSEMSSVCSFLNYYYQRQMNILFVSMFQMRHYGEVTAVIVHVGGCTLSGIMPKNFRMFPCPCRKHE
jgi:hypothetical protein